MPYELYPFDRAYPTNHPGRRVGVTLSKHGQLRLNAETYALLGAPQRVRLFYDRAKRVLAIKASSKEDAAALRIWSFRGLNRSYHVSAKGFYSYFGLHPTATRWYSGKVRDGALHVSLM